MDISVNPTNKTQCNGSFKIQSKHCTLGHISMTFLGMGNVNSLALFSVVYSTDMQDLWISVKEMIERISAKQRAKGHDQFIVALQ